MYPEYLYNNDTQEISLRVCEMASANEPALRAHCQEVSRQTDTSSLALQEECHSKINSARSAFEAILSVTEMLAQSVSKQSDLFGGSKGKAMFSEVCRAMVQMEEERGRLLFCIAELTHTRHDIASCVAKANQALHLFSVAKGSVPQELRSHYVDTAECVQGAYECLKRMDVAVCEVQKFYMTFIESHISAFMERIRAAADFNHTGAELDGARIYALCKELLILQNRIPNVAF